MNDLNPARLSQHYHQHKHHSNITINNKHHLITSIICTFEERKMIGRLFCFLLALQTVSLVSAIRKPFLPAQEEVLQSPPPYTTESKKGFMDIDTSETMQEAYDRGVSKIGSSPPSCEHKCYGCVPCEAIQVPSTSTRRSHLGIQYANYEPESWKCKCGPSFYSP